MASELRMQFRTFSDAARPVSLIMDDVDQEAVDALRNAKVRAKHYAIQSASAVVLSGFFESFLRQSAEAFFKEISRRGLRYEHLPLEMRKIHFKNGLELAAKYASKKSETSANFAETLLAVGRIAEPPSRNVPSLIWEAFAVTRGNPGPDVIAAYMSNFGVKDGMRQIANACGMDANFLNTSLGSFIQIRNECAHTGLAKNPPLPSEVRGYVDLLRRLSLGISRVLERRVTELTQSAV